MRITGRSRSLSRFLVKGELPRDPSALLLEAISRFAFRRIDPNGTQERSVGWVNPYDVFDTDFSKVSLFLEPYLTLTWRIDVRRVPKNSLLQCCRDGEREFMKREHLDYIPRQVRRDIREASYSALLARAIPTTSVYDAVWDLQSGVLLFGGTGTKLSDDFSSFFHGAFGLHLTPLYPYTLACVVLERIGRDPLALDNLAPSVFFKKE